MAPYPDPEPPPDLHDDYGLDGSGQDPRDLADDDLTDQDGPISTQETNGNSANGILIHDPELQAELDADDDWQLESSPLFPHISPPKPEPGPRRQLHATADSDLNVYADFRPNSNRSAAGARETTDPPDSSATNEPATGSDRDPSSPSDSAPSGNGAQNAHRLEDLPPIEPMPTGPLAAGDPADLAAFLKFLRDRKNMPLASMVGTAFAAYRAPGMVTFLFESSRGNMIPMLTNPVNAGKLKALVDDFFGEPLEPRFDIKANPAAIAAKIAERERLEAVRSNPKIKFILERFGGRIDLCEPLQQTED